MLTLLLNQPDGVYVPPVEPVVQQIVGWRKKQRRDEEDEKEEQKEPEPDPVLAFVEQIPEPKKPQRFRQAPVTNESEQIMRTGIERARAQAMRKRQEEDDLLLMY